MEEQGERVAIPERLQEKYAIIDTCIRDGMQKSEIARGLRMSPSSVTRVAQKINSKYDIAGKSFVKLAAQAHKMVLQAASGSLKEGTDLPFVLKGSDVSAAIDRTYDRYQPKVTRTENLNVNLDCDPVDIERFRCK